MSEITDDYWEIIPSSEYMLVYGTLWFLKKDLHRPSCFLWPSETNFSPLSLDLSFAIPGDNEIKLPAGDERNMGTSIWVQNNGSVSFSICHDDGHVIVEELSPEGMLHIYLVSDNEWRVEEMITYDKNGVGKMVVS